MLIMFNAPPSRPDMIFDPGKFPEVKILPGDIGSDDEARETYMLTPVSKRLVQLIAELITFNSLGHITIEAVEKKVVVDTGLDAGEPMRSSEYVMLSYLIANLDNATAEAFVALEPRMIRELAQDEIGMQWWDTTNQGSAP